MLCARDVCGRSADPRCAEQRPTNARANKVRRVLRQKRFVYGTETSPGLCAFSLSLPQERNLEPNRGGLRKFSELFRAQLAVPNDLVKEAGADCFTRMDRHNSGSSVLVAQEMMAASDRDYSEPAFASATMSSAPVDAWSPAHAATVTR